MSLRRIPSSHRRSAAFSLLEILLVFAVLLILMLLSLRIRGSWKTTAEKQSCTTAMACLRNASRTYDQVIPVPLNNADASGYFVDLASNGTKNRALTPMEYFVFQVGGVPAAAAQMDRATPTMLVTEQPQLVQIWKGNSPGVLMRTGYLLRTVKDPWGTELKYRASSVAATEADPALPASASVYFASAGPDLLWGTLTNHDAAQPDDDAKDNIYLTP